MPLRARGASASAALIAAKIAVNAMNLCCILFPPDARPVAVTRPQHQQSSAIERDPQYGDAAGKKNFGRSDAW